MTEADSEYVLLSTDAGRTLLEEVAFVSVPLPVDLLRWRKTHPPEVVSAAVRLATARRRGSAKFSRADRMWLDPIGLEQSTAEPVARHKARRFAGQEVVDLCCGIGGDALALGASARSVIAVDLNQAKVRRARWNAEVYGVSDRVVAVRARAETFPIAAETLVHIDPDRRAQSSGRSRTVGRYVPGLEVLHHLRHSAPGGAIKLGPASDFAEHFGDVGEVEIVSLGGECKEATVWFGSLAGVRHRATSLPSGASWTDRDGPAVSTSSIAEVSRWIYDPDPSLIRSGLLAPFAAAHGLARVAPGVDFLSARERVVSPFLSAFAVREVWPLDLKRLRRLVADRGLGPLEIKTRALKVSPEALRRQLRPQGPTAATLFLFAGQGPGRAVLASRVGLDEFDRPSLA